MMSRIKKADGFVSIFSVLIIMAVLTLVLVGFSSIIRQAQRRTLDDQLSTQAFYAAESGVNDAIKAIKANPGLQKTECQGSAASTYFTGYNSGLDGNLQVGYTCVLVNDKSPDFQFDSVPVSGNGSPKVFNLQTDGNAFTTFSIAWDGVGSGAGSTPVNPRDASAYPRLLDSAANWGGYLGMLRIDMIPTDTAADANALTRSQLATQGYTFYLYPYYSSAGGSIGFVTKGAVDQAGLLYTKCPGSNTSAGQCRADITLGSPVAKKYTVRLQAIYNNVKVRLFNFKDGSGNTLDLVNGQSIIDATGKANDVFRRIQVRVPSTINGVTPPFGLETATAICKRLNVAANTTVDTSSVNSLDTGACATN